MVLTATFDVEETPMKLVFLDMAKYIALFCTNGTLHIFSVAGGDSICLYVCVCRLMCMGLLASFYGDERRSVVPHLL